MPIRLEVVVSGLVRCLSAEVKGFPMPCLAFGKDCGVERFVFACPTCSTVRVGLGAGTGAVVA